MQRRLYNIAEDTTTTLIPSGGSGGSITSIILTNSSTSSVDVDLYLAEIREDSTTNSHIATTNIPSKTSLLLEEGVSFDNSVLSLKITTSNGTLTGSNPLSIIIK